VWLEFLSYISCHFSVVHSVLLCNRKKERVWFGFLFTPARPRESWIVDPCYVMRKKAVVVANVMEIYCL
jgi:hypothetical protein